MHGSEFFVWHKRLEIKQRAKDHKRPRSRKVLISNKGSPRTDNKAIALSIRTRASALGERLYGCKSPHSINGYPGTRVETVLASIKGPAGTDNKAIVLSIRTKVFALKEPLYDCNTTRSTKGSLVTFKKFSLSTNLTIRHPLLRPKHT